MQSSMATLINSISDMSDTELIECHTNLTNSSLRPQSAEGRTFDLAMLVFIEMEQGRRAERESMNHPPQVLVSFGNDGGLLQEEAQQSYAEAIQSFFVTGAITREELEQELAGKFITQEQFNAILALTSEGREGATDATTV